MVNVRDDRWTFIDPANPELSLLRIQEILRDFEERLSGIDVDGVGLVIPDDFITQAMLAADSVGAGEIQAGAVGSSELAADAVTAAKLSADVAGLGLSQAAGGELDVNVDGITLEIVADTLQARTVFRTATTTPITVTAAECLAGAVIFVKLAAPGAVAVSLPAGVTGYRVTIKDATGDATINNVTTTPAAGTIDGAATDVIAADYASRVYAYNGTEWSII